MDEPMVSGTVLSEEQATLEKCKTPVLVPDDYNLPASELPDVL